MAVQSCAVIDIMGMPCGVINGDTTVTADRDSIAIRVGEFDSVTLRLTPANAAALTATIANALHVLFAAEAGAA